jgi:hypothetical protein
VVSFLQAFPQKNHIHVHSIYLSILLYDLPVSSSIISPSQLYLKSSTTYKALYYAAFYSLPSLPVINILLSTLSPTTLSVLLLLTEAMSHNHTEPQTKNVVSYMITFTFLDEKESSGLNKLLLIFSCIEFVFVTVFPKCLNCAKCSNDRFAIFISRLWPTFCWLYSNIY